jgi:peptidyl-tRNA hydrolase
MSESKMFVVVRSDLEPGLQAAQACHALREMTAEHPLLDAHWHATSKTLVLLQVPRVSDLEGLVAVAQANGIAYARNYEPDLGGELTAVAFGHGMKKHVRGLQLLLSEKRRAA